MKGIVQIYIDTFFGIQIAYHIYFYIEDIDQTINTAYESKTITPFFSNAAW